MSVGLPGSGIGGVFYLLSALWMPFDGAIRSVQKRERRNARLMVRQVVLALAIIAAIYVTGVGLEQLITNVRSASTSVRGGASAGATPHVFEKAAFILTFSTLALVLLSVQVLRLFYARAPRTETTATTDTRKAA